MLELRDIVKDYVSGNNVTHALKGVSVTFRKNEFVSILGASGCGKTTLLNIIGGLDRYTSGDLLILGKSTKEYKDRDWDTYRNHSIGFVFQTYNLIAHQNILKNVELALTISGVSKEERKQRAYEALKLVGLEGMEKKKPNQLSGGQCQRVAIARALINNPEILLADEPTGALDSETSIQIMDLLKEVAADRLVIMVTHNPELATKYSTRIINMKDGLLIHDSNPYDGKDEKVAKNVKKSAEIPANSVENAAISKGKKKKTSMSLLTSIGLSTSNLVSKMKRTVLVVIAGSIGIIGVSAVLAASRGVKDYIANMQNDMLSSYPVSIAEESVDYTSLITGLGKQEKKDAFVFDPKDPRVGVDSMISYLMNTYTDFTNVKTNTIDKKLLSFIDGAPKDSIGAIIYNYGLDPTNNIFGGFIDHKEQHVDISLSGLTQRYIKELTTVEDFGQYATFVNLFTNFMRKTPSDINYIADQYDVLAGNLSLNKDDLVLVVDKNTTLTDVTLGQMGVFDHKSFLNIAICAMKEQEARKQPGWDKLSQAEKDAIITKIRDENRYDRSFKYEDIINRDFYYFPEQTLYGDKEQVIDASNKTISVNFVNSGEFSRAVTLNCVSIGTFNLLYGTEFVKEGTDITVNSIACMKMDALSSDTRSEIKSKEDLKGSWIAFNSSDLLNANLTEFKNDPTKLIEFVVSKNEFMFVIDDNSLEETPDPIELRKITGFNIIPTPPYFEPTTGLIQTTNPIINEEPAPVNGFAYKAEAPAEWINNPESKNGFKMKISAILRLKEDKNFGTLDRGLYYTDEFAKQYVADSKNATLTEKLREHIKNPGTHSTDFNRAFVKFDYEDQGTDVPPEEKDKTSYASSFNVSSSISDLFSGFSGAISGGSKNEACLRSLCGEKVIAITGSTDLAKFEYLPKSISIYPKNFEAKDRVTQYLDRWNSDEVLVIDNVSYAKADRNDLTYSDTISLIVSVINTFIDAITVALVVFTSLSLVVSCFMIAVITYISVVERIKEIGVIRSLGGRKRDVAGLFVMETFMTGLFSGVFGIAVTYVLQVVVNIILNAKFGLAIIKLTIPTALLMIGVSVVLSVLSGLIPSQSAAHKDPVVALRSNE